MKEGAKTVFYNDKIISCDNLEDLRSEILSGLESQRQMWIKKIREILETNNYSQANLASLCGVSRATVLKWVRGSIPQSREMFIRIGFAAKYDYDEMNKFLQRYGRYPGLYPKTPEDSIYIFVLKSDTMEHSFSTCAAIIEEVEEELKTINNKRKEEIEKIEKEMKDENFNTEIIMNRLLSIKEKEELELFIKENRDVYATSFDKFYCFVKDFVRKNNESFLYNNNPDSINMLADTLGWSSSLKHCLYQVYRGEWFPTRNKVISLGIRLNMTLQNINDMLKLAKMEPLYVLNPFECVIIYSLLEAELNDIIYEGTDGLYQHVIEVMQELGFDDSEYDIDCI